MNKGVIELLIEYLNNWMIMVGVDILIFVGVFVINRKIIINGVKKFDEEINSFIFGIESVL